ncbi:MAG: endonuclease/exonuclease/phosphatase family protein [Bacteroides sp.]|nr:endonuclease/exonuclease/phosphatase family protein [Bacteroides sp.]
MKLPRLHRPLRSTVLAIGIGLNLLIAMLTVFSAYGGTINPDERVIAAMAAMGLPIVLAAGGVLFIADLIICRRLVLILIIGWCISLPSILVFCPLNGWKQQLTDEQRKDSFTFLTYNAFSFVDFRGEDHPDTIRNATIDYIISTNADIVSLQEPGPFRAAKSRRISQAQIDTLSTLYPYQYSTFNPSFALLSKYPFNQITIETDTLTDKALICFRLNIKGYEITLFDIHLDSFRLTPDDKEVYKEALDIPKTKREMKREIKEVKSQLLSKLAYTIKKQAFQARQIRNIIDSIGGPMIVAGDFNNIPDSYPFRTIRGKDMHDAYADAGFGPTITYHGNMFYFRIDQVLYRGPFKAVDIERGDITSSDHYPLLTTFLFDSNK